MQNEATKNPLTLRQKINTRKINFDVSGSPAHLYLCQTSIGPQELTRAVYPCGWLRCGCVTQSRHTYRMVLRASAVDTGLQVKLISNHLLCKK
jgi:hypothetical protein